MTVIKKHKYILILCVFTLLIIIISTYGSEKILRTKVSFSTNHFVDIFYNNVSEEVPIKVFYASQMLGVFKKDIAWWTDFSSCPQSNCIVTRNISEADAVLFAYIHARNPGFRFPAIRYPHQNWIFFTMESPSGFKYAPQLRYTFNLTFSYRSQSDIVHPYNFIVQGSTPWTQYTYNTWQNKSNVVWLASVCRSQSKREDYVKELSKHIDVTILGKCGSKFCPTDRGKRNTDRGDCKPYIQGHFKFYLAFENSLCKDYATEKVFTALRISIIPIVMGHAEYEKILPPKSFINVKDFKSAKHLADYLHILSNNYTLYNEYFEWKSQYRISGPDSKCTLCDSLHRVKRKGHKVTDLEAFWAMDKNCLAPNDLYNL